jgi:glycosyltransferase involved in cell wall biosynthesis
VRIVFFTRRYFPQIGGVETHVKEVAKKLVEKGNTVAVVAEQATPEVPQKYLAQDGIAVIRVHSGKDDWFKKFRIWKSIWENRDILKNADIVHCHDVFFWYFPFKIIYPRKKVYTTFHGYETVYPPSSKAIFIRKISELLSDGNICVGDYIKKWYHTKADFVTYGGVDSAGFHIKEKKRHAKKPKILLLGRFEKDIGVQTYLKGLAILKIDKFAFDFQAVGDGELSARIKKFGRVHGPVPNILPFMKAADIVFCSSYLTMLEALIMKKIVVAVYENKLKEDYLRLSPFASYVYICKDAREIASVVHSIHDTPWKSTTMIENGYKWAKNQSWESVVKQYFSLWQR